MNKVIDGFRSLFGILRLYLKAENPTVIFYYPQHFNRSKKGDNDFFKPLIDSCKNNAISYLIFEEPAETTFPRNEKAIKFDFVFFLIMVLRKIMPLNKYPNFEEREVKISSILKPIFLRRLKPKIIITMSNSMLGFFRGWGKDIEIFDYQHGIIYATHPGYMVNGSAASHIKNSKSKVLLYGNGFKNLLINVKDKFFVDNAKVIGTTTNYQNIHQKFNGKLLVTMPFVTKDDIDPLQIKLINQLTQIFEENSPFYLENNIQFYLKHHPRFDGSVDISTILAFPFVQVINQSLMECFELCSVHLTFNSTTTFDAAIVGVPTLFLGSADHNKLFNEVFKYPNFTHRLKVADGIVLAISDKKYYQEQVLDAQNWVKLYYEPFSETAFLKLINEKD